MFRFKGFLQWEVFFLTHPEYSGANLFVELNDGSTRMHDSILTIFWEIFQRENRIVTLIISKFTCRMRQPRPRGVEYAGRRSFSPKVRTLKKGSKKFLARNLYEDTNIQFDYESGK